MGFAVTLRCLGDDPISFLVKAVMRLITIIHYVRRGEIQFEPIAPNCRFETHSEIY